MASLQGSLVVCFELGNDTEQEHQNIANLVIAMDIDEILFVGENFYKSAIDSKKAKQYKSFSDFESNFNILNIENTTFLIKGSRGWLWSGF